MILSPTTSRQETRPFVSCQEMWRFGLYDPCSVEWIKSEFSFMVLLHITSFIEIGMSMLHFICIQIMTFHTMRFYCERKMESSGAYSRLQWVFSLLLRRAILSSTESKEEFKTIGSSWDYVLNEWSLTTDKWESGFWLLGNQDQCVSSKLLALNAFREASESKWSVLYLFGITTHSN